MKKVLLTAALIIAATTAAAHAAFENIAINIDSSDMTFNVSGEITDLARNEPVKLIVLKPGSEQISADTIFLVNERYTENRSSFAFDEKIPPDAGGGSYIIYLQSPGGGIYTDEVMYMTGSFLSERLEALNSADGEAVGKWISDNAVYFELDRLRLYEKYLDLSEKGVASVASVLADVDFSVSGDNSDLQDKIKLLTDSFETAVIVAAANNIDGENTAAIKEFFEEYSERLVIKESIDSYIKKIGESENDRLLSELFAGDFKTFDEILDSYYAMVIVKAIENTSHWSEVCEIFENEADIMTVDSELAEQVGEDDLYKAYHELTGKQFNNTDAAVKAFEKACRDIINSRKNTVISPRPGGGSGGGSGGNSGGNGVGTVFTPTATPEPAAEDKNETEELFSDLDGAAWARDYINELARRKVISGYGDGRFGPMDNVTRGQFARILVNAFGLVSDNAKPAGFSDVGEGHIFKEAVDTVYSMGIVYGVSEDCFNVDGDISREDVCTIICRTFDALGFTYNGGELAFEDAGSISEYARDKVALMYSLGIVSGDGGYFKPKNSITRAELSRIICMSINRITEGDLK